MPFGRKKEAQQLHHDSAFRWGVGANPSDLAAETNFVSSRGLLAVCDVRPCNPESSQLYWRATPLSFPHERSPFMFAPLRFPTL